MLLNVYCYATTVLQLTVHLLTNPQPTRMPLTTGTFEHMQDLLEKTYDACFQLFHVTFHQFRLFIFLHISTHSTSAHISPTAAVLNSLQRATATGTVLGHVCLSCELLTLTCCHASWELQRVVLTVLNSFSRQSFLVSTNVTSALEVF